MLNKIYMKNNLFQQYSDRPDFPYPAIRFREEDDTIKKLRTKEKNDWNKLTVDEKKARKTIAFF